MQLFQLEKSPLAWEAPQGTGQEPAQVPGDACPHETLYFKQRFTTPVLAALCGSWAGAAAPDKEGARPCPAPGGEGQQKTAEPESPGHPSLPSELELQGTPGCPCVFP